MSESLAAAPPLIRPSVEEGAWERWLPPLVGLLLACYLLDESVPLKVAISPLIGASALLWVMLSRFGSPGSGLWRLLLLVFLLSCAASLASSALQTGVSVNAFYPLLFVGLAFRRPTGMSGFLSGLFLGMLGVTLFGWYRFVSGEGGLLSEHALGYWGLKYTQATRNSDALAPILLSGMALSGVLAGVQGARRVAIWAGLLLALPALALTFARSAWLAVILFLVLQAGSNLRTLLRLLALALLGGSALLVLVAVVAPDAFSDAIDLVALLERLQSIYDPEINSSNDERSRLLTYAFRLGLEHPILGAGAGQFNCCVAELGYRELIDNLHPENIYFHLWSEYGVVPATTALALHAMAALRGLRSRGAPEHMAGATLAALILWLQMNSELPSLLVWSLLGVATSLALRRSTTA